MQQMIAPSPGSFGRRGWEAVAKHVLYPLNQLHKGISPAVMRQYFERDRWTADDIAGYQRRRLRQFLRYAADHCRYYRRVFAECGVNVDAEDIVGELKKVPPLDKDTIRANLPDLWSDEFPTRKGLTKKATGGSTGTPLEVWGDREDYRLNGVVIARQRRWIGWVGGCRTISYFGGFRDLPSRRNRLAKRILINDRIINIMDRRRADFTQLLGGLRAAAPTAIVAYFSVLKSLARAAEVEQVPLSGVRLAIAAGEPLEPEARRYVERWLGCPVYFQYGCRELGTFAQECRQQAGYHYAQDIAFCEVLDDRGKDADYGLLTITYFGNRVVPLIRYQIGEGAALDRTPCACGLPYDRLSVIHGRLSTMMTLPDGRRTTTIIFPHVLKDFPWVREFQAEQEAPSAIVIRVRRDDTAFSEASLAQATATFRDLLGADITIRWAFDEPFLDVPTGKHVYFISKLGDAAR